jgi:hypothetical protein
MDNLLLALWVLLSHDHLQSQLVGGRDRMAGIVDYQSINQNAQPAMLAGQLTLTQYHVTSEPRRE